MPAFAVAALYRFVRVPDPAALREPMLQAMREGEICGSLLLADEGINGTIAGPPESLRQFVDHLRAPDRYDGRFVDLDVKWSTAERKPFRKTKVRLKKEIVTLGQPGIDPQTTVGTYVEPEDWNALIDDPDVTLIDTRNDYEVQIGTFETAHGPAVNPQTATFRDLPAYVEQHLDPARHKKVAMFCTGGIRCEKSTAYLKSKGFDEVYHLRGGILKYLENVPEAESRWRGECFVFDRRVSVGHGLARGTHELCHACGWPIAIDDTDHPDYVKGVSCPRCVDQHTPEQRDRFAQRQRQFDQHQIA